MGEQSNARRRRALLDLRPGVQARIISELDRCAIAPHARAQNLANLCGCALQTAMRWVDPDKPGLPDVPSLAALCVAFGVDANWLLGLVRERGELPPCDLVGGRPASMAPDVALSAWARVFIARLNLIQHVPVHIEFVAGDEMEPEIRAGSPVIVDTTIRRIDLNGVYALRYAGRVLVRRAEVRIGEGVVLHCANSNYRDSLIPERDVMAGNAFDVVGRVRLVFRADEL
ncbi:S24 family peptidase [Massilia sp. TS11]|uniref:S24 family peptidase n=1 Tax=Massilia sp. TS11 TaxID=2908003 RepID=UPI001EDAF1EC|nr:S24 family peptidase [Massilia sp. TS11]MCG2583901.1 S24 family peptidase [Massilia sp. TS11]